MPHRQGPRPGPGRRDRGRRPAPQPERRVEPPADLSSENIVMVQFKGHRKGYYHNRRELEITPGDYCMVEADRGRDMGRICFIGPGQERWWKEAGRQGLIEIAKPEDLQRLHENRADEWEYYDICLEKIQERNLKMNLVTVERQFDRNKITFFFTADKRVDFRQLVKDLAGIFRTRIELRQIGVRDEAKMKGGIGVCGRELCCSTFLQDFSPVTLKMAKAQQLPLSPNKLSGLCGRLRCCLSYEHEGYRQLLESMPRVGSRVRLGGREGIVRKLDLLDGKVTVFLENAEGALVCGPDELSWDVDQDSSGGRPRSRRGGRVRRRS